MSAENKVRPQDVRCGLWFLQRDAVRMTPGCERPAVKLGIEGCYHFLPKPGASYEVVDDVTERCRRAQLARQAPRLDDRLTGKSFK